MTKTFCDLCDSEIGKTSGTVALTTDNLSDGCYRELCGDCYDDIKKFIKSLRKVRK